MNNKVKIILYMACLGFSSSSLWGQQGAKGDTSTTQKGTAVSGTGNVVKSTSKTITNVDNYSGWQGTQQVIAGNEIDVRGIRMFSGGNDTILKKETIITTNISSDKTIELKSNTPGLSQASFEALLAKVDFSNLGELYQSYNATNKQLIMFDMPTKNNMIGFSFTPTQGDFSRDILAGRFNNLMIKIAIAFVNLQGTAAQLAVYRNIQGSDEWQMVATPLIPLTNTDLSQAKVTIADILPNGDALFFNYVNGKPVTQTIALGSKALSGKTISDTAAAA